MATIRQIEANRRNAGRSTGPKTEAGKARSRVNAVKHGLGAIHVALPHEDPAIFDGALEGLLDTWQPEGDMETQLVGLIASSWLSMQRAERMQAALMDGMLRTIKHRNGKDPEATASDDLGLGVAMGDPDNDRAWKNINRCHGRAQSAYFRAIETLRRIQADRFAAPARELRCEKARRTLDRSRNLPRGVSVMPATRMGSFGPERSVDPGAASPQPATVPGPQSAHQNGSGNRLNG